MRSFFSWFSGRRRIIALALIGVVAIVVFSAGRTPDEDEWFRVPDLGGVLIVGLVILAISGLVIILISRPKTREHSPGEVRSLRAVLIFTALVVVATVWYRPPDVTEEIVDVTLPPTVQGGQTESFEEVESGVDTTDLAALALILLAIAAVAIRNLRRATSDVDDMSAEDDLTLQYELAPAVSEAQHHLSDEDDPRTAVLLAYASLERALAAEGQRRHPTETPSEHIARVLADIPTLARPAVRLGKLYEVARFSDQVITEDERGSAALELRQALDSLPLAGSGTT